MNRTSQLGEEPIIRLLVKFSVPAIIGMLVNALYNVIDRIYIGNGVGSLGIAGITIGFPVMLIMMACGMLIAIGATSLISIRLGEQKTAEAEHIMGNAVGLLIGVSAAITILGSLFLDPLLGLLGASDAVFPYAKDYMQVILFGAVFQSIGFGMNNFIRAEGNPKIAMMTMLIGAILNMLLDPLFIFTFGWGIRGAAIATVISQAVSSIWVLYYFLGGGSRLKIRIPNMRLRLPVVKGIVMIGFAPFAMQLAASVLNLIMNKSLSFYGGDIAISGMGIVYSVVTLMLMPIFGISQGVQPIIGYNYGAKQYTRVKEALSLGIIAATAIVTLGFIITRIFPTQLIAVFSAGEPELIAFGERALQIFLILLPIIGFQIVGANYFQAVGKPKQAMILSLSRQVIILIPAMLILPRFFGVDGILMAGPLSDLVASILTAIWLLAEVKGFADQPQLEIAGLEEASAK